MLALASGLDDVVDYAEEAADFLGLYRVEAPMDQAIELADTLAAAGRRSRPRSARSSGDLRRRHTAPGRDQPPRGRGRPHASRGLTALFEGGVDPMVVIRWKDIFERVEDGIDACDSVAHMLRGIAVKRGLTSASAARAWAGTSRAYGLPWRLILISGPAAACSR